ncbi:MAG: ABC transporter ATP-binding protein [Chryseolinea sp.]
MPPNSKTNIEALKQSIRSDLVGSYSSLLEFSEQHALPHSKLRDEVILLGSQIFEGLDEGREYSLGERRSKMLTDLAEALIDRIANDLDENLLQENQLLYEKLREHFLKLKPTNDVVFDAKGINKSYGHRRFKLHDINVTLRLGEITGVVGENGNGKTTLLKIIAGELLCDGNVSYPMISPALNWNLIKKSIAYIPQDFNPLSSLVTLRQHLHFTAAVKGIRGRDNVQIVDYIINRFNLKAYENLRWHEISGGYRLRFELARQLIWSPKLMILDEPLANLDIKAQTVVLTDLRNLVSSVSRSMALIISSQNLYEIEKISDNIIFIKDGKAQYNGAVGNIGLNLGYRCFELDTDCSVLEVQKILSDLNIRDIKQNGPYTLLSAEKEVTGNRILAAFIDAKVPIYLFREITNSTRLFFEQ